MTDGAVRMMTFYSAGHPRVMHIIGDVAFWQDEDGVVDEEDTTRAIADSADEVGRKFVDRQVVDEPIFRGWWQRCRNFIRAMKWW